jgi:hypothetical protein
MPRQKCTQSEFIEKARSVHGDLYDYSRTVYLGSKSKVEILCKEHGPFLQTPKAHMQGQGCPECRLSKLGRSLSLDEFKQRVSDIHGGIYAIINASYVNASSVIEVACPTHGTIKILANSLLRGSGCRQCAMEKKKGVVTDTASFIEQANRIHRGRYEYPKVDYRGTKHKVIITCLVHGDFHQTAETHLQGRGCPICASERKALNRVDDQTVFSESRAVHGDKYQYIGTIKKDGKRYVRYICPFHGEVKQEVRNHRIGMACPKCASRDKTTEQFIEEVQVIHGNDYDYSQVEYSMSTSPVTIICRTHGAFMQTPNAHLHGCGCARCGKEQMADKLRKSPEEFLAQARLIHGEKYQYPDLSFSSGLDYITIVCPKHGEFRQQVSSHINQESGCPKCWRGFSRGEERIANHLKAIGINFVREETFNKALLSDLGVPLRYDFYLPSYNLLIEFDGAQHYFPFKMSADETDDTINARYQRTCKHDEIKNEYARAKEITLVRISYLEYESIETLLDQAIAICVTNLPV